MSEQELNTLLEKPMAHYQRSLKQRKVMLLALLTLALGVMLPLTAHAKSQEKSLCSELRFQSSEIQQYVKNNPQTECVLSQKTIQDSKRYMSLSPEAPAKTTSIISTGLDTLIFLISLIML